jgi:hypothetical protein
LYIVVKLDSIKWLRRLSITLKKTSLKIKFLKSNYSINVLLILKFVKLLVNKFLFLLKRKLNYKKCSYQNKISFIFDYIILLVKLVPALRSSNA